MYVLLSTHRATYEVHDVKVGPRPDEYMHTLTTGKDNTVPLVYIPGYGAGGAFMFRMLDALSAGFRTYLTDLLGTGLSGRPPYKAKNTEESEAFFVESLSEWKKQQGLDKMVLVGHSLGGYLSAVYAMKHPEDIQHLILVCPAGIGGQPEDWHVPETLRNPWTLRGQLFRACIACWDWGLTPMSVIRTFGPWGRSLVNGYVNKRFNQGHPLNADEVDAFQKYMYHIVAAKGSGEFALHHLLAPFAWARYPIEQRLAELNVPVTFIYGEFDWMDIKAAHRCCEKLKETRKPATASDMNVFVTKNAGHYPQIDQPGILSRQIMEACEEYLPLAARERMKAEIAKMPYSTEPATDTAAELKEEMESNPVAAEAHVIADM